MPKPRKFWEFRNLAATRAELLLYGDIASSSWWGDEVTPKEFAQELSGLGAVSEIDVRINSGGGDVFAAQAIGNLLEQHAAYVTARIDGLCGSAATIVACHCNYVIAANDTAYMMHKVKMGMYGYMDADQLQKSIEAITAIRENIVGLYAKKTGRDKDEVAAWMDATSWWTAAQAKENGFVDELTDEGEDTVVENRNGVLFVNSVDTHTPFDKAPKFVQDSLAAPAAGRSANKRPAGQPEHNEEDQDMDIKTVDDLRNAYPAMVAQIEKDAAEKARTEATNAERERIRGIEDAALSGSEALAAEAKYDKPMSVSDFTVALVKNAKAQGAAYLAAAKEDAKNSGVNNVTNTPPAGPKNSEKDDEFLNAIKGLGKGQDR